MCDFTKLILNFIRNFRKNDSIAFLLTLDNIYKFYKLIYTIFLWNMHAWFNMMKEESECASLRRKEMRY